MSSQMLTIVVTGLMSGGFVGSAVALYSAHRKVPVEVDSIIVSGAESAVLTIEKTLAAETRRADRAEARESVLLQRIADKEARIEALEHKLDALQNALDDARKELHSIITTPPLAK